MQRAISRSWFVGTMGLLVILGAGIQTLRASDGDRRDPHSASNPAQVRARHLDLDLKVDFGKKELSGTAIWSIERQPGCPIDAPLILDTRELVILGVETAGDAGQFQAAKYHLSEAEPVRGQPLEITIGPKTKRVRITYHTTPESRALQWAQPPATAGKQKPLLYSQSQAIAARSWFPCQDSPGARMTYHAKLRVPATKSETGQNLRALMSAQSEGHHADEDGCTVYEFTMDKSIPSYLVALAVGDLERRELGERTGVWAEPAVIAGAASEFIDTEKMLQIAEKRFGPYRWGRYEILVMPPSFPFGGMENARLTFATPTVLVGDRSLVSLVAHELSHSWSGNLVTCATWQHFWLNEGLTTYLERRVLEDLYGTERAAMEWEVGRQDLDAELAQVPGPDQVLEIDLDGRDPDTGMSSIPYEKGSLFFKRLELAFGRDPIDVYLRGYFDRFAFRSITTGDFETDLRSHLFATNPGAARAIDLTAWLHRPGLPSDVPIIRAERFRTIEAIMKRWLDGQVSASELRAQDWSTLEGAHFLRALPRTLPVARLGELDSAYHWTGSPNAELAAAWYELAIRANYRAADAGLEAFLTSIGRGKFVIPLYTELARTPDGKARARSIYAKARPGYHPFTIASVDKLLGVPE